MHTDDQELLNSCLLIVVWILDFLLTVCSLLQYYGYVVIVGRINWQVEVRYSIDS